MARPKSKDPSAQVWRQRTREAYPIKGKFCQGGCGGMAQVRHHRNGVLSDLSQQNIQLLCRGCHVQLDNKIIAHRPH